MVILDHLSLFIPRVLCQQPTAAEGNPLNEEIERLAFVRCCLNRSSQFDVGDVVEKKSRLHHTAQFSECNCDQNRAGMYIEFLGSEKSALGIKSSTTVSGETNGIAGAHRRRRVRTRVSDGQSIASDNGLSNQRVNQSRTVRAGRPESRRRFSSPGSQQK